MPRSEDTHIGKRIRQRRWALSLTQGEVADKIGVKFQQLQKYETGANRVSGSRLCDLAAALDVSPAYFFEGLGEASTKQSEVTSAAEGKLLKLFRSSNNAAQASLLSIAELTACTGERGVAS
ncbi:helix-turn-helix domain-containing protein [Epibacterium ulvae]|uniref:helix-turn-helix domain-containing protein n=1 Tax=Epibacterium ulvae TaxID=1156985 RepID=UPI0024908282|nr:helix-turn-helix transcriptional regulator [Epibacterium ulvae]